jgi:hypothetical protein
MQVPPHINVLGLQEIMQLTPLQVGLPIGSVGQGAQLVPHVATSPLDTQAAPQAWKAPVHSHWWLVRLHVRLDPAPQSPSTVQPLLHMPLPRSQ